MIAESKEVWMAEGAKLQLSLTQIVASALATVSAAVAASFIGVYGTIIGAAIMSVVSTVGTTVYEHTMHRSKAKLRDVRDATLAQVPTGVATRTQAGIGVRVLAVPSGVWGKARTQLAKPAFWKAAGAVSLLVFAIAIGTITIFEGTLGKSMHAAVTGKELASSNTIVAAASGGGRGTGAPDGGPGGAGGSGYDGSRTGEQPGQRGPASSEVSRDRDTSRGVPAPSSTSAQDEEGTGGTAPEPARQPAEPRRQPAEPPQQPEPAEPSAPVAETPPPAEEPEPGGGGVPEAPAPADVPEGDDGASP